MSGDQELQQAFYLESADILERLAADVESLDAAPENLDLINSIFRGIHTIKGNSSFLSLERITKLSHSAESILDRARKKELPVTQNLLSLIRKVLEDLKVLIVEQSVDYEVTECLRMLESFGSGDRPVATTAPRKQNASEASIAALAAAPSPPQSAPKALSGAFVRVDEGKVGKIISLVSELELLRYSLEQFPEKMDKLGRPAQDIRFDLDLQISKLSRLTRTLSGIVYGVRLVPVNAVFQRFPRVVKELAAKLGKEIRLDILNGEAELDKSIVEAIADPMTHLIRNSADHGIESVSERVRAGKSREGRIRLNSYVKGNFVYIDIEDDGKGIDGDKVLAKAVEKGIVPLDKVSTFTESKKLALIFAPGFSTAEKVTDISGRGVGMDVVKSNINRLKGTVIIQSEVGKGTTIQLRFPMSVVVLFSLFVEVNQTMCALAVDQVNESLDFLPGELLGGIPSGAKPEEYLTVYSLRTLLWGDPEEVGSKRNYHAIRLKDARGLNMAFLVDDFSSLEEAIVQSVDSYIAAMPGIQGATIRKDGSVALVLNPESLVDCAMKVQPFAYVKIKEKVEVDSSNLSDFLSMASGG